MIKSTFYHVRRDENSSGHLGWTQNEWKRFHPAIGITRSLRNLAEICFFFYIYWIFSYKFLVLWWFLSKLVDKGGLWSRLTGKTMRERHFFVLFQCQHIQICCVTLKKAIQTLFLMLKSHSHNGEKIFSVCPEKN